MRRLMLHALPRGWLCGRVPGRRVELLLKLKYLRQPASTPAEQVQEQVSLGPATATAKCTRPHRTPRSLCVVHNVS